MRLGLQDFKDLVDRFGGDYFAIASYNAGENRIAQWRAEKPDLAEDEFIDDIPFPETQTYVKRILGTAEDYRRLYGSGLLNPNDPLSRGTVTVRKASAKSVKTTTTPKKSSTSSKKTTSGSSAKKAPASTAKKPAATKKKP